MRLTAFILFASIASADVQPAEVLEKMAQTYKSLKSIQISAHRRDEIIGPGMNTLVETEYDFAEKGGGKYRVNVKSSDAAVLVVSDGSDTWKALPRSKQWLKQTAAASAPDDDEEERGQDTRSAAKSFLLARYTVMKNAAASAELLKEEAYKLGKSKVPCYVIRVRTADSQHDLWIDKERYLVLQHLQSGRTKLNESRGEVKISLKVKQLDVNADLPEALFRLEPEKGWKEAEMLVLPGEERLQLTGQRAANFTLKTLDGDQVALDALNGKVVVLDFWASWCGPCRREMPALQKLKSEFAGKVAFLGINDEEPSTIKSFLKKNPFDMTVLLDGNRAVHRRYGIRAIPTLFIIDGSGVIREHFIGSKSESSLRSAIEGVVNAK